MQVPLVFITKYRYQVFDGRAIASLRTIFSKVCTDFEATLVEIDGEDNHVHLLPGPTLIRRYWKCILWSPSYFAASCGGTQSTKPTLSRKRLSNDVAALPEVRCFTLPRITETASHRANPGASPDPRTRPAPTRPKRRELLNLCPKTLKSRGVGEAGDATLIPQLNSLTYDATICGPLFRLIISCWNKCN
jgi:putative transposase